ncbi:uncharacterized protein LOC115694778 isoform X2 [Cannabis sativa]|uniref:uncharacterized protein LOC115694778 isoform X2 n=1 Tax=Cannabis sativa TaxID=3483 RepID=UPI0029CA8241|nr:uncharacterized protein LOC115694778 isoform X2 [Cannabis sativa]
MSKLFSRVAGFFSNRTKMGVDKAGNRYFARKEEIDGVLKEKRWVIFKGEDDPTSIPVEWICWLNGQRKKAPTSEEREEMEARRERVRLNVALMKKEEEERKLKEGSTQKGKAAGPDLSSFIRQFPGFSEGMATRVRKILQDQSQSLRSQQDRGKHTSQGHGSHQHELWSSCLLFWHKYKPNFLLLFDIRKKVKR